MRPRAARASRTKTAATTAELSARREDHRALLLALRPRRGLDLQVSPQGEFAELCRAAGAESLGTISLPLRRRSPRTLIGPGQAELLAAKVAECRARLVIVNCDLRPAEERNLERAIEARVLGYSGLVLDIFARRARSFEGKLQVELAQLIHLSTRLVRTWTHLERQKGGIGLRGPGESQLETDRRLVRQRIRTIRARLQKLRCQRDQNRRSRKRSGLPLLSLVGYTNAGKSTLFNRISRARVAVRDQLFATLDPTMRRIHIDGTGPAVLADTVGFIRALPHHLIEAFQATLEEVRHAHLLLHVMDSSCDECRARQRAVDSVLETLGAHRIPQLHIYNKIDRCDAQPRLEYDCRGNPRALWMSARDGTGVGLLHEALATLMRDLAPSAPWARDGSVLEWASP